MQQSRNCIIAQISLVFHCFLRSPIPVIKLNFLVFDQAPWVKKVLITVLSRICCSSPLIEIHDNVRENILSFFLKRQPPDLRFRLIMYHVTMYY